MEAASESRKTEELRTLTAALAAVSDLVFRVGSDGHLIEDPVLDAVNAAKRGSLPLASLLRNAAPVIERMKVTGSPKTMIQRVAVDGRVKDYEIRFAPDGDGALVTARDVSHQTRIEENLQLFIAVTLATAGELDTRATLETALREFCETTGWASGQAWLLGEGGLRSTAAWHAGTNPALAAFVGASRDKLLEAPDPLIDRVLLEGRARGVRDLADGPVSSRGRAATAAGLRAAFAVPVLDGEATIAVLEFHSYEPRDEDEGLLAMVNAVASQLGTLVKRKHAEEELRLLKSAVQQMDESFLLMTADLTGSGPRIVFASPGFARMTGWSADELVGQGLELFSGPRTDRKEAAARARELAEGKTVESENVNYGKGGREMHVEWRIAPVRDASGAVRHFVALVRDLTDRKAAEDAQRQLQRALENAARQWRLTFDAIESPVLLVDADGRIVRLNRAATLFVGVAYQAMLAQRLDAVGEEWSPLRRAGALTAEVVGSREPATTQFLDEVTGRSWQLFATLVEEDGDDKVILVFHDITRLVELQESLRRLETSSTMAQLVAGVAHEVRNPLHAITVTMDAFLARFPIAREHEGHVRVLRGEVARLSELMRVLHEYGTTSRSRLVEGDLADAIDDAIGACRELAGTKGIELERSIPEPLPRVHLDRGRLAQAIVNLVDNALHHAPQGSRVVISAVACRDGLECRVADSGPGFREADLSHVFRPFFTRRRGGRGLGLSIAQRVVDEHHGRITAANRPEGGAIVIVRLPLKGPGERG
jgi:PAS domain S-box-containing protein